MPNLLLETKNLCLSFLTHNGEVQALSNISFQIYEGEIVGLVGESGCGKSITSLAIMDLLPEKSSKITNGSIFFKGKDLVKQTKEQKRKIRGKDISMIFQEPMTSLNPVLSIENQLIEGALLHLDMNKKEAREHILSLLEKMGIPRSRNIINEYPHQLSGGMRQRVMISMALACNPSLLIADEPTTALDVTIQSQILDLLKNINSTFKTSILFITHDLGVVSEMCDRVVVMYAGQIVETGKVDILLQNPSHPYTKGLIRSIPKLIEERKRLDTILGTVPQLNKMPKGCRFAPRCTVATEKCSIEPNLVNITKEHSVKCWYPGADRGGNIDG